MSQQRQVTLTSQPHSQEPTKKGRKQKQKQAMQNCSYLTIPTPVWTPGGGDRIRRLLPPPPISAMARPRPPATLKTQKMPAEKKEIFKSLESWASTCILPLLKPVEQSWQPQNLLPDSSLPFDEFADQVKELRCRTAELPDDYLVVLVGDMITEEALPTYQTWINSLDGVRDETGSSPSPWAIWSRSWTAEENRHGDLLKTYLYLSGRVDMLMVEKTVQHLIGAGVVSINNNMLELNTTPMLVLLLYFTHYKL